MGDVFILQWGVSAAGIFQPGGIPRQNVCSMHTLSTRISHLPEKVNNLTLAAPNLPQSEWYMRMVMGEVVNVFTAITFFPVKSPSIFFANFCGSRPSRPELLVIIG